MKIGKQIGKALAFALLWMPMLANAYEWENSSVKYKFTLENGRACIFTVELNEVDISGPVPIPSNVLVEERQGLNTVITWYPVHAVGRSYQVFQGVYGCNGVYVNEGVEEIGAMAFQGGWHTDPYDDRKFFYIRLPTTLKTVGSDAFSGCEDVTVVNIDELAAWCNIDFANACANPLASANAAELKLLVPNYYVNGSPYHEKIVSLNIPEGVHNVKAYTFYRCRSVADITFPLSCESIGAFAFYGCYNLRSLSLHDNITSVGTNAFQGCTGLVTVSLGNGLTHIPSNLFQGCASLSRVDLVYNFTPRVQKTLVPRR